MSDDNEAHGLVLKIQGWLDHPQSHLNDQSRRKVLELMVADHVDKVRRTERTRARAKDLLLFAAILTAVGSFAPRILTLFGWTLQ